MVEVTFGLRLVQALEVEVGALMCSIILFYGEVCAIKANNIKRLMRASVLKQAMRGGWCGPATVHGQWPLSFKGKID